MTVPLTPVTAVTAPDPYPYYAQLVAERPFAWSEELGSWVAASAAAVSAVLAEPALRVRPVAEPYAARSPLREAMFGVPAYTVAVLCGLDGKAAGEAARLIADFVACIPASATTAQQAEAAGAAGGLIDLLGPALDERRDGLLGALVDAARPGTDRATLLANGVGLLSQTFDATAGLIGGLLVTLGRHTGAEHRRPAELPAVVREVARYDAPIQNTRRFAAEGVTIDGVRVAAGDPVLVVLAAANRDPARNLEPGTFRPGRRRPAVFTFGAGGHGCPGETVAVAIAAAVVAELLAAGVRPEDLRPTGYLPLANARIPVLHP